MTREEFVSKYKDIILHFHSIKRHKMFYSDSEIWVSGYIGKRDFLSSSHSVDFLQGMSYFMCGFVSPTGDFLKIKQDQ
jgi:hypothetical protein